MRPRAAALLFALALAACATKPPLPPVAPTQAQWYAVSAPDFTCKPGQFANVELQDLLAAPTPYYDKCVRVRGLLSPQLLTLNAFSSNAIGIYAKDVKTLAGVATHSQFAFVSGRLRSCGARAAQLQALTAQAALAAAHDLGAGVAAPPTLSGFCRLNPGPALYLNRVELIPTAMD
jgi:hypothetical protein